MTAKKYLIATIKTWNIDHARQLQKIGASDVKIIADRNELTPETISEVQPRYIFFPHWSWKIPASIYQKWECVVFHMTDLPFGRGGSPLQNLITRGIYNTKISAIKVVEGMDAGPVYMKHDFDISTGSADEMLNRAADVIFNEMIPSIINNEPTPVEQKGGPVLFKRRTPELSDLSGINEVRMAYDHIRMLDGEGYPPAYIDLNGLRYEFKNAREINGAVEATVKITAKEKG